MSTVICACGKKVFIEESVMTLLCPTCGEEISLGRMKTAPVRSPSRVKVRVRGELFVGQTDVAEPVRDLRRAWFVAGPLLMLAVLGIVPHLSDGFKHTRQAPLLLVPILLAPVVGGLGTLLALLNARRARIAVALFFASVLLVADAANVFWILKSSLTLQRFAASGFIERALVPALFGGVMAYHLAGRGRRLGAVFGALHLAGTFWLILRTLWIKGMQAWWLLPLQTPVDLALPFAGLLAVASVVAMLWGARTWAFNAASVLIVAALCCSALAAFGLIGKGPVAGLGPVWLGSRVGVHLAIPILVCLGVAEWLWNQEKKS